jgi:hypothetical protein
MHLIKCYLLIFIIIFSLVAISCSEGGNNDRDQPPLVLNHGGVDDDMSDDAHGDDSAQDDDLPPINDSDFSIFPGNGFDPFDPEYNEGDCPLLNECSTNTPPSLFGPYFAINGQIMSDFDPTALKRFDLVAVLYAFDDAQCNIACGSIFMGLVTPDVDYNSSQSMPSNIPCVTDDLSLYFGFRFFITDPAFYHWTLRIQDLCGEDSDLKINGFTVPQ